VKRHFQGTKVYAAEDALQDPVALSWTATRALVERVCGDYDVPIPPLVAAEAMLVARDRVELPHRPSRVTVLHALAHLLTDPTFPPHGSEFAGRWLNLVEKYGAKAAPALTAEYDARGIHHTAECRVDRVGRAGVYLANNRPGHLVELVLDDPPERVVGSIEGCTHDELVVGGRTFPLERGRYLYKAEVMV
jgi:hypothetical protein